MFISSLDFNPSSGVKGDSDQPFNHCVAHLFCRSSGSIICLEEFLSRSQIHYMKYCLPAAYKKKFLVTENFQKLLKAIDSGKEIIAIRGPKGVGKSLALAAIEARYSNSRPCFLFSPDAFGSSRDNYLLERYFKGKKDFSEDDCKCFNLYMLQPIS